MSTEYTNIFTEKQMDTLASEFPRLKDQTYLDHAGATLYADSQIINVSKDLLNNLYSNPHTSKHTADCIDQVRFQVLNHFNTDSNEYGIIFTSGTTASIKLVAESFAYEKEKCFNETNNEKNPTGCFAYLNDNHTSVLGMREIAASKSATVICLPPTSVLETIAAFDNSNNKNIVNVDTSLNALFAYPAQCNFSGYKYPLEWIKKIQDGALNIFTQTEYKKAFSKWAILLDAAAFVSTNKLDLSEFQPDFVCLSFYKLFGYPTGLGALIVKNSSAHLLSDEKYFGGGTVEISLSGKNMHKKRSTLHERFEDGTNAFLSIMALKHGFNALKSLIPPVVNNDVMDSISLHTFKLAKAFYDKLKAMKHFNGMPIACFYSATSYTNRCQQGGIVNFNLCRFNGNYIGYAEVTHMAELFKIHIRSGCFCNPGACQYFLELSNDQLLAHHKAGHFCGDSNDIINGVPTGSIRVSFGYMSSINDVNAMINMISKCFLDTDPVRNPMNDQLSKLKLNKAPNSAENLPHQSNTTKIKKESDDFKVRGSLEEIHIYPIKSCAAFKIYTQWEIGSKGFLFDREWMIVTENGVALTQKQDTRMCLIKPLIDLDKDLLRLSFPGIDSVDVSISETVDKVTRESSICQSKICGDKIEGIDCGNIVADWLTNVLGIPGLRLIRQSDVDKRSYKTNVLNESRLSLSNKAQYLAINLSSVNWLVDMIESKEFDEKLQNLTDRFRGNLIFNADIAFEEMSWKCMKIGSTEFQSIGPCTRCQMVCIDQENGEKTIEPLRTISKQFSGKINFGCYFSKIDKKDDHNITIYCKDVISAK